VWCFIIGEQFLIGMFLRCFGLTSFEGLAASSRNRLEELIGLKMLAIAALVLKSSSIPLSKLSTASSISLRKIER
jgi:heme/copper-type cytochrome/quinol oxidase subunit 3